MSDLPPAAQQLEKNLLEAVNRSRITVLVVEDDAGIQYTMNEALRDYGVTPLVIGHPAAIDPLIASARPDVLIIDLMLPQEDGITIAGRLRASAPAERLRIVGMSASDRLVTAAQESGFFDAVLPKPFSADELMKAVLA